MAIHIKKSREGEFHRDVGKSPGQKITEADIQKGEHSSNPAERKRAVFAENARHWDHSHGSHVKAEISHHETHGHGS